APRCRGRQRGRRLGDRRRGENAAGALGVVVHPLAGFLVRDVGQTLVRLGFDLRGVEVDGLERLLEGVEDRRQILHVSADLGRRGGRQLAYLFVGGAEVVAHAALERRGVLAGVGDVLGERGLRAFDVLAAERAEVTGDARGRRRRGLLLSAA